MLLCITNSQGLLNVEKWHHLLKSGMRQAHQLIPLLFTTMLEILVEVINQEKVKEPFTLLFVKLLESCT